VPPASLFNDSQVLCKSVVCSLMKDRWETVWQKLAAPRIPYDALDELMRAYSFPDRYYHNFTHIQDCLSIFDQTHFVAIHPEEVELGIWFHDAVYDTTRSDNEQKSAEWAKAVIHHSGLSQDIAKRVADSILATRHHGEVTDQDAQLLVDVDLSILGREPLVFWRYEENIRQEYTRVPEDVFRQERVKILKRFLDRPQIYYHREYRERFEERARTNLEQAIAKLGGK
jgi:predicted metal-dependent HD superfamily phosphohydrolase